MKFSHPLARTSRFLRADSLDAGEHEVFVVVTTLELEPSHKRFKPNKVERLRQAARDYLREHCPDVRELLIMNPVKT